MEEVKVVKSNSTSKIEQKRCPHCGSSDIEQNPITGKLRCNYCRYEFELKKVEGFVENINELQGTVIGAGAQDIQQMVNNIITCKCSGCGAEITLNANEIAFTKCHWCHTGLALNQQVPSGIVPDAILPFKVSKQEAFEDIKKLLENKKAFASIQFLEEFSIDNLRGVYLPYMMVDVNGHARFIGTGQKITDTNYSRDKDGYEHVEDYDVDIYDVEREFDIQIQNLMETTNSAQLNWKNVKGADRSLYLLNTLMPYDVENCVSWDANYLNGYTIEKRDVNIGDIADRMGIKAKDIARIKISDDLRYDGGVFWDNEELEIHGQQWKTIYLPVWIYTYIQKTGEKEYIYYIAQNARTKEMNYTIPFSIKKLLILPIIGLIIRLITGLLGSTIETLGNLLQFAIAIFLVISFFRYNHIDSRNKYERETKSKIFNIIRKDEFKKHKRHRQKSDNSEKLEGDI